MADINIPGDYATIQEGINNAQSGDKIIISDGTYNENLTINIENLTLEGKEGGLVNIEGNNSGNGLYISGNNIIVRHINVSKFNYGLYFCGSILTLEQCTFEKNVNVGVRLANGNSLINYCMFYENQTGIIIDYGQNIVKNNSFVNNVKYAMRNISKKLQNTEISANSIMDSEVGISIDYSSSEENIIYRNLVHNCDYGIICKGNRNNIYFNTISNSKVVGISCSGQSNIYNKNELLNNKVGIIGMEPSAKIYNNVITLSDSYGMNLLNESGIAVKNNIIVNNINGLSQIQSSFIIPENTIRDNGDDPNCDFNICKIDDEL